MITYLGADVREAGAQLLKQMNCRPISQKDERFNDYIRNRTCNVIWFRGFSQQQPLIRRAGVWNAYKPEWFGQ